MKTTWTVEFTRGGACGPHYMLSDNGRCFARLYQEHGNDDETISLIAAAPDLLEALEGLLSYDRVVRPAFRSKPVGATGSMARIDQDTLIRLEDNARAAINKAKGEL